VDGAAAAAGSIDGAACPSTARQSPALAHTRRPSGRNARAMQQAPTRATPLKPAAQAARTVLE